MCPSTLISTINLCRRLGLTGEKRITSSSLPSYYTSKRLKCQEVLSFILQLFLPVFLRYCLSYLCITFSRFQAQLQQRTGLKEISKNRNRRFFHLTLQKDVLLPHVLRSMVLFSSLNNAFFGFFNNLYLVFVLYLTILRYFIVHGRSNARGQTFCITSFEVECFKMGYFL